MMVYRTGTESRIGNLTAVFFSSDRSATSMNRKFPFSGQGIFTSTTMGLEPIAAVHFTTYF